MEINNREVITEHAVEGRVVSVMIPAYNAAETILGTLDCVYAQTYRPVELVVINDGSTDETESVVKQWIREHEDPGFSCILHSQANAGLLNARRAGLEHSTGKYLQFLDADDLLHPKKFSICLCRMQENGWDVAVGRVRKFKESDELTEFVEGDPVVNPWKKPELDNANIAIPFWHSSGPVFTRDIVERAGPAPESLNPAAEEMEFHARVKCLTKKIGYLDEVLTFYRIGQTTGLTSGTAAMCMGRIDGAAVVHDILVRYGIADEREWYWLFRFSLLTFYRSHTQGCDVEIVDAAYEQVGQYARCCRSPLAFAVRLCPAFVCKAIFAGIELIRRLYRREPLRQTRKTLR